MSQLNPLIRSNYSPRATSCAIVSPSSQTVLDEIIQTNFKLIK